MRKPQIFYGPSKPVPNGVCRKMIGESGVFRHLSRWKGVHISHMKAIDFIAGDGNTLSQEGAWLSKFDSQSVESVRVEPRRRCAGPEILPPYFSFLESRTR